MFNVVIERREFNVGSILTTVALASVVSFPTDFGAGRRFCFVMFNVVIERRDFNVGSILTTVALASVIGSPTDFSASRCFCFMMFDVVIKRRDFNVSSILTTVTLAGVISFPSDFRASSRFCFVTLKAMPYCRYFFLFNQHFATFVTMSTVRKPRLCAGRAISFVCYRFVFTFFRSLCSLPLCIN